MQANKLETQVQEETSPATEEKPADSKPNDYWEKEAKRLIEERDKLKQITRSYESKFEEFSEKEKQKKEQEAAKQRTDAENLALAIAESEKLKAEVQSLRESEEKRWTELYGTRLSSLPDNLKQAVEAMPGKPADKVAWLEKHAADFVKDKDKIFTGTQNPPPNREKVMMDAYKKAMIGLGLSEDEAKRMMKRGDFE